MGPLRAPPRRAAAALAGLLALLCGAACGARNEHDGRGVVEEVSREHGQILVAHEDIPGVMQAMTMNFPVADPALLDSLQPGDEIEFVLRVSERGYTITRATVVGQVEPGAGWTRMGEGLVRADPAPDFALVDEQGRPRSLGDYAGRVLLLDFIFTRCPGPCPILTSNHVTVQRRLSPALRERAWFVSISLDPERDTPDDMRRYAQARGADLEGWSFLTGPVDHVEAVVRAYRVGKTVGADGEIQHLVASFLIDAEGRIARRYLGLEHDPDEIAADLEALANPGC